jgi:hypothetical protein
VSNKVTGLKARVLNQQGKRIKKATASGGQASGEAKSKLLYADYYMLIITC